MVSRICCYLTPRCIKSTSMLTKNTPLTQHQKASNMEVPYLYISLLLLLASYLFTSHFRRKSANLPPTIFPTLPIIGHLYLLKPPIYRTLSDLSAKYGPVLLLRLGFRPVLLISSPSVTEECFTKNDIIFANRPHMLYGKFLANNYTSLVFFFLRRKLAPPSPHCLKRDLISWWTQRIPPHAI
ncbi:putative isoflavone 2'-hydroxylase [Helianthus annuus]|nr:putative isoflavone 2'-hydroxylase [Helianthus annuus]